MALWLPRPPPLAYVLTFLWAFFIAHSGVLIAVAYLTWGRRMTPRPGAVKTALLVSLGWTALAAIGCLATGGNDMFLREPPPGGSLLDLFGPWPWYVLAAGVIAVLSFLLLARLRRCGPVGWWRGYGELSTSGRSGVVLAWALYDFANTMFSFAIVSFAMSLWSIRALGEGPGLLRFTVAASASVLLNALLSPVLGGRGRLSGPGRGARLRGGAGGRHPAAAHARRTTGARPRSASR